jgi:hypothetical protein
MRTRLDSFRAAPALLAALALGAVLVLAGCGDKNLILTVDILSFLSPAETSGHYGPIPAGTSGTTTIIANKTINLLPGLHDITAVTSVQIDVSGEFANATGTGNGSCRIYLSPEGTDPFVADTTPIVVPVTFNGASTDTVSITVAGDSELADLFVGEKAQLGIRLSLTAAPGPDPVEGEFALIVLRAVVEAKQAITN